MKRLFLLSVLVVSLIIVTSGWASNNVVKMQYEPAGISPDDCPASVAFVKLKDAREENAVGKTRKGELFYGDISPSEWVSKAFYDEMNRAGCRVEFHEKEYDFDTDFTLSGEILELFAEQVSLTKYSASVRLRIVVKKDGEEIFSKTFSSSLDKKTVPSPGVNSKVLTELLQAHMLEVVPEIRKKLVE